VKSRKALLKKIYKHEECWQHKESFEKVEISKGRVIENAAENSTNCV